MMENDDVSTRDLPDDLTPFITQTTLYPVSGGGFGDVWKCNCNHDANGIPTLVAVKAFRLPERYDLEKINRKISREIGILKILRHKNIVPLWGIATGFGRMPELRCLVSPWIPNGTLNDYLQFNHDDLTVLDRSRMLEDVSTGLYYLHSVPVMHGDITGANILIDEGGHARLIDFGLSTITQPLLGQSHLAATSIRPGAVRYAAPELVLSDDVRDLDSVEKADIYSFGCVMLQILSGQPPWSEVKSERLEFRIVVMITEGRRPQRPDGHPEIMDSDWNFIQKCLQSGPELRPSADKVLDFVMHRFHSPDSCSRPPDDPFDDAPDDFPRASPHGGSNDSDTTEQPPDSPPLHPSREPNPSIILEPRIQGPSALNDHPRTMLNNLLQRKYGPSASSHVRWEVYPQGLPHAPTWHAIVYIDDMIYGHGTAHIKHVATEMAAAQAVEQMERTDVSGLR
ncbi:kinase-like domain-containing protein [Suillus subaureus]|uniref:Kinase-like domain-containing protein n=1 Tax=Suillus subaureus TaxID=48587 RepID=A0A9P7JCL4_9AGAM|nr:kinase-like domain-containing protein [Suillus subaureus]KAG1814585.1 kinase-like domain-containing protein [Suillus subaureus]